MERTEHYAALERMYLAAPINAIYRPSIEVGDGRATIAMAVTPQLFHAGGTLHGSVYFKMLDDAAYFAAASMDTQFFLLTGSFTSYILRPVADDALRAEGRVVSRGRSQMIAEAVVTDGAGREVARGSGAFMRGRLPLADVAAYAG